MHTKRLFLVLILIKVLFVSVPVLSATFSAYNTGNWSSRTTWITTKSGTITVASGATLVLGTGTSFTTELQVGDRIYTSSSTAFNSIGTIASINSNEELVLTSGSSSSLLNYALYSHGIPASNDDIQVGYYNGTISTTLTVDGNYICNRLYIVENDGINYTVEIPSSATLTVNSYLYIVARNSNGNTNKVNVHGTLNTTNIYLYGATVESQARVSQVAILTGGTVNVSGDINISDISKASKMIISSAGTGVLNLGGNFINTAANHQSNVPFTNPAILTPGTTILPGTLNFESTSAINLNGVDKLQVLPVSATTTYGNVHFNNTGNQLATLSGAITTSNLLGNMHIGQGIFSSQGATSTGGLGTTGFSIAGNSTTSFSINNSASFRVYTSFPTGFGTVTLQPTSMVNYNGTGAQTVSAQDYGNLTVSAGASARTITLANTGAIRIASSFSPSPTNNTYTITGSTISFNGTTQQRIPSTFLTYNNLTINNSTSGNAVILDGPVTVNNILTLTNGKLLTTSTNILTLGPSATITLNAPVSQDNSFINGPMIHTVATTNSTTKTFPVGQGDRIHKADLIITHNSNTSTQYTGEYIGLPAKNLGYTLPNTIDLVSTTGYWGIHKGTGATVNTASVTLYYNDMDGVLDPGNLRVAKDDGAGAWLDIGGIGTGSSNGSITSSVNFTSFSYFPLANSTGGGNTLPVSFIDFKVNVVGAVGEIKWQTASEKNNDYFTIERSKDAKVFEVLHIVEGSGTSNKLRSYEIVDEKPLKGASYYRIKQTDFDKKVNYSPIVKINNYNKINILIYPNPIISGDVPQINVSGYVKGELFQIDLIDNNGNVIWSKSGSGALFDDTLVLNNEKKLASGIYFILIKNNKSTFKQKFIVQ